MKLTNSYFPAQTGYEILNTTIGELLSTIAAASPDSIAMVDILNTGFALNTSGFGLATLVLLPVKPSLYLSKTY